MKKIKYLIISLITIFTFNINVYATSGSLGVSSLSVYVGDSFTVTVNVKSAAAWNVHVSASGPVSGCVINQADATADAMDTNKTFSATCTATGEGTITVRLSGDVTSASDGNAVGISGSRSVTVSKKPTPPSNNNNNNNNNRPSNNNNTDTRSKNSNIKELSIEGYDLVKVDNNNYTLSVPNDVTSVNIKATAEDSKSKVTGAGNHDINVGENNIEIVVTAENGSQNKINVKVTRKDGYYLDDLESVLKNNKVNDINININADTKLTSSDLQKIKESKKTVKFNYYKEDKSLLYSWIIDGSKINEVNDINTTIKFESENKKDILRLSNYADGMYVHFEHSGTLPSGTKIKLYVGDKFEDNDVVNVYYHNTQNDTLDLIEKKLTVKDGYIEFYVSHASEYFVTMSTIQSASEKVVTDGNKKSMVLPVIIGVISLLIIGAVLLFMMKKKKTNKNNSIRSDNDESSINATEVSNNSLVYEDKQDSYNNYNQTSNYSNYSSDTQNSINNGYNNQSNQTNLNNENINNISNQSDDNINLF